MTEKLAHYRVWTQATFCFGSYHLPDLYAASSDIGTLRRACKLTHKRYKTQFIINQWHTTIIWLLAPSIHVSLHDGTRCTRVHVQLHVVQVIQKAKTLLQVPQSLMGRRAPDMMVVHQDRIVFVEARRDLVSFFCLLSLLSPSLRLFLLLLDGTANVCVDAAVNVISIGIFKNEYLLTFNIDIYPWYSVLNSTF